MVISVSLNNVLTPVGFHLLQSFYTASFVNITTVE